MEEDESKDLPDGKINHRRKIRTTMKETNKIKEPKETAASNKKLGVDLSSKQLPVSLEFFKRYTFYEECVDMILKMKAKENLKLYESLTKNEESKDIALKSYYEAFYLKPKIREKYHIRLKPMPKNIKDKLLIIPTKLDSDVNKSSNSCPMESLIENMDLGIKDDSDRHVNREEYLEKAKDDGREDVSKLLSFPDRYIKSPTKMQTKNQQSPEKSYVNNSNAAKSIDKIQNSNEIHQINTEMKDSSCSLVSNKKVEHNYKELFQYAHCCPLTFNEFLRYTNIKPLVKELAVKKHLDEKHQYLLLNRFYILFYLAPEHRNSAPIKRIHLIENCPQEIKNKFFIIPTKLYLKSSNETNKNTQSNVQQISDIPFRLQQNIRDTKDTPAFNRKLEVHANSKQLPVSLEFFKRYTFYEECVDMMLKMKAKGNLKFYESLAKNNESKDLALKAYYEAFYLKPKIREKYHIRLKPMPKNIKDKLLVIPAELENCVNNVSNSYSMESLIKDMDLANEDGSELTQQTSTECIEECVNKTVLEISNKKPQNDVLLELPQDITASNNKSKDNLNSIELPVSLKFFKKYTYYEECIDMILKAKANGNSKVYESLMKNPRAKDVALNAYYKAFYLKPKIREQFHIRLKAVPKNIKKKLLIIPTGLDNNESNVSMECPMEWVLKSIDVINKNVEDMNVSVKNYMMKKDDMMIKLAKEFAEGNVEQLAEDDIEPLSSPDITAKDSNKYKNILPPNMPTKSNNPQSPIKDNVETTSESSKTTEATKDIEINKNNNSNEMQQTNTDNKDSFCATVSNKKDEIDYKELMQYVHCCPLTYMEFLKYTNIKQLVQNISARKHLDEKHQRLLLNRFYMIFYLAPDRRTSSPINKIHLIENCPQEIKNIFYTIPTKLFLKNNTTEEDLNKSQEFVPLESKCQKTNTIDVPCKAMELNDKEKTIETSISMDATNNSKVCSSSSNPTTKTTTKSVIPSKRFAMQDTKTPSPKKQKIATTEDIPGNTESTQKSYHELKSYIHCCPVTLKEFTTYTNVTDLFKGFCQTRYKSLQKLPYMLQKAYVFYYLAPEYRKLAPLYKLKITKECPKHVRDKINEIPTKLYSKGEKRKVNENETQSNTKKMNLENEINQNNTSSKQQKDTVQILENRLILPAQTVDVQQNLAKSMRLESEVIEVQSNKQQQIEKSPTKNTRELWKALYSDKIFNTFRQKLLTKLQQTFDKVINFSDETYNMFIHCNDIPLQQLLNDFCENDEQIVQRILNDIEICEALKRYFYSKFLTNENFAKKYPVKLKKYNEQLTKEEKLLRKSLTPNKLREQQENLNNKTPNTRSIMEKAKRIFFRNVEKTNTLSYVLRTSFGLKQLILKTVLTLTYKEFIELTNIYEGFQLYDEDDYLKECMYRYVFRSPLVWPTNLYISLKNLCDFLHSKNIRFNDYATMLQYVSPKILHWSCLLACTNIVDCVKIDYENRTGKSLTSYESLRHECVDYYNRCWKEEKWLGDIPKVNEEFYREYLTEANDEKDEHLMDVTGLQEICVESSDSVNETMLDDEEATKTTKERNNLPASSHQSFMEFNCVILPNTQQQIEMLPSETNVTDDPLNYSKTFVGDLSVTNFTNQENDKHNNKDDVITEKVLSNCEADEIVNTNVDNLKNALPSGIDDNSDNDVITIDETIIKTEPIDEKLLSHLLFYEDDNDDIQCMEWKDEVVNLDLTVEENSDNLPPSQMDFDDMSPKLIVDKSDGNMEDINFHSQIVNEEIRPEVVIGNSGENSDSMINLVQRLPSSNEGSLCSQQLMPEQQYCAINSTQLSKLPSVSSRNESEESSNNIEESKEKEANCTVNVMQKELGSLEDQPGTSLSSMQSFITCAPAQRFPSTFEDLQNLSGGCSTREIETNKVFYSHPIVLDFTSAFENLQTLNNVSNIKAESNQDIYITEIEQKESFPSSFENVQTVKLLSERYQVEETVYTSLDRNEVPLPQKLYQTSSNFEELQTLNDNLNQASASNLMQQNENLKEEDRGNLPIVWIPVQEIESTEASTSLQTVQTSTSLQVSSNLKIDNKEDTSTETTESLAKVLENIPMVTNAVQSSSSVANKDLPLGKCIKKNTTTVKKPKNVAKVRPLKNSDYVPQIQHNTRPLQTQSISTANKNSQVVTQQTVTCSTTSPINPILTTTATNSNPSNNQGQIPKNTVLQLPLSSSGTHIFLSQEFNKNCSVFNNSSLLRIVDHNYNKNISSTQIPEEEEQTTTEQVSNNKEAQANQEQQDQPARRVTRRNSSISLRNTVATLVNEEPPTVVERRVTRRSSLCQCTNNNKKFLVRNNEK